MSLLLAIQTAAGPVTVTPGFGALVVDGFAPTVQVPVTVRPSFGETVLTGFEPTIQLPITVRPGVGGLAPALLLEGFEPTILLPITVRPGVGELLLDGYLPTIQTPVTVRPGFGELVLSGFEPTVVTSSPVTVTPGVGELVVAGFEPTIQTPVTLTPAFGALVLAGFEPTILTPVTVTPGVGVLEVEGFAPTLSIAASVDVTPGVGELSVEGYAPEIDVGVVEDESTSLGGSKTPEVQRRRRRGKQETRKPAPRVEVTVREVRPSAILVPLPTVLTETESSVLAKRTEGAQLEDSVTPTTPDGTVTPVVVVTASPKDENTEQAESTSIVTSVQVTPAVIVPPTIVVRVVSVHKAAVPAPKPGVDKPRRIVVHEAKLVTPAEVAKDDVVATTQVEPNLPASAISTSLNTALDVDIPASAVPTSLNTALDVDTQTKDEALAVPSKEADDDDTPPTANPVSISRSPVVRPSAPAASSIEAADRLLAEVSSTVVDQSQAISAKSDDLSDDELAQIVGVLVGMDII